MICILRSTWNFTKSYYKKLNLNPSDYCVIMPTTTLSCQMNQDMQMKIGYLLVMVTMSQSNSMLTD